jgi:hypothetical protein
LARQLSGDVPMITIKNYYLPTILWETHPCVKYFFLLKIGRAVWT